VEAQLRGRVAERWTDSDFKIMERISRKYIRKEFPMRDNADKRVVLVIEIERARFGKLPFTHTPA
jgi:hypothetical protein